MKYDRKIIGSRFKDLRLDLGFSQSLVSDEISVEQGSLSAFENGTGGGMTILLGLLNFYGRYYKVSNVFLPQFSIMKNNNTTKNMEEIQSRLFTEITELEEIMTSKLLNLKIIAGGSNIEV